MTTTITCYGGINEIGSNKILVEDGEVRVFLDFGKSFGRYSDYFDGVFVRERTIRGLLDALALGLIPPLEGLYRDDLIPVFNPGHVTVREEEIGGGREPLINLVGELFGEEVANGEDGDTHVLA